MAEITDKEVLRIARLARIYLPEGEVDEMRRQLARILEVFSILQAADLDALPPAQEEGSAHDALREDGPAESLSSQEALSQAPDSSDGHIRIPRVLG